MKIVADSNIPFVTNYFDGYGELLLKKGRAITADDVRDADILLVRSVTPVNEALLANSKVKFVGSVTAGYDHLDTKWLDDAGIIWSVALGFNAPPVADYVLSVIAALQNKGCLPQEKVRAAVIGAGNVGRLVIERLQLLNFDITVCDPVRAAKEPDFLSTPMDDLADFDLISLHVPLTRSGEYPTRHFINQEFLQRQKENCVLLNASRGAVIHSRELLKYGTHMRWCFDVWEHEPHINKSILQQAFIATPHIAGYSVQSKIRGIDIIYRIACDTKMIEAKPITPLVMPRQRLDFSGQSRWQDVVLGVFNPMIITTMMRELLLPDADDLQSDAPFDDMRNQFNYRYELGFTNITNVDLSVEDAMLLEKLGVKIY